MHRISAEVSRADLEEDSAEFTFENMVYEAPPDATEREKAAFAEAVLQYIEEDVDIEFSEDYRD